MREVRVARDAEDAHPGAGELGLSVTQEPQLLRSGARPVEEVEEQEDAAFGSQLFEFDGLAVLAPDHLATLQTCLGAPRPPRTRLGQPLDVSRRGPSVLRRHGQHQLTERGKPSNCSEMPSTARSLPFRPGMKSH